MYNCLTTKLKDVVADNSLMKINEWKFQVLNKVAGDKNLRLVVSQPMTITTSDGQSINAVVGTACSIEAPEGAYINIPNKYALLDIMPFNCSVYADIFENAWSENVHFDILNNYGMNGDIFYLSKIKGCKTFLLNEMPLISGDIKSFENAEANIVTSVKLIRCSSLYGDIGVFKRFTNLEVLELDYSVGMGGAFTSPNLPKLKKLLISDTKASININTLGTNCLLLEQLNVRGTSSTGSIEQMAQNMCDNGRVSGSILLTAISSNVTYRGVVPTVAKTVRFSGGTYTVS